MSHIVSIKTQLRNPVAITAACTRLGLPAPVQGTVKLYSGYATGLQIRLPNWRYPVVVNTETGQARLDNFGGTWGDRAHLDRFLQAYAVELTKSQARTKGFQVTEQALQDGSIKVQILES